MLRRLHRFTSSSNRTRLQTAGVALLLAYLLLFSVFALFHVYGAGELDDAHGCAIGVWLHLSLQAALAILFQATLARTGTLHRVGPRPLFAAVSQYTPGKRGPPLQLAF